MKHSSIQTIALVLIAAVNVCADTTPNAVDIDQTFERAASYKPGDDHAALDIIESLTLAVADTDAAPNLARRLTGLARHLTGLAANANATPDARRWALRQLAIIATPAEVPAVAPLLADAHLSHMARNVMLHVPGPEAAAALRTAVGETQGAVRIGLIHTIGERGDGAAITLLDKFAGGVDGPTAVAAIRSLGKLGALDELRARVDSVDPAHADALFDALLVAAAQKPGKDAQAVYAMLMTPNRPAHLRIAALRGAVRSGLDTAALGQIITGDDQAMRVAAIRMLQDTPGDAVTKQLVGALDATDAATQIVIIDTLAQRGDKAAGDAVAELAGRTDNDAVRAAAILALRDLGSARHVPALAKMATTASGAARTELRRTLAMLPGDNVDATLVTTAGKSDPDVQEEIVRALNERGRASDLFDLLRDDVLKESARSQAFMGVAVAAVATSGPAAVDEMGKAFAIAKTPDEKKMLLGALARIAEPRALTLAESYAADPHLKTDAERAAVAIRKALDGPPVATASHNPAAVANALDGNPATRWDSASVMRPGMWFMVDYRRVKTFKSLTLDSAGSASDFARGYKVYVGDDPANLGKPVAIGEGKEPVIKIDLGGATGRYLRIEQTGSTASWYWSLHELSVNVE